MARIFEQMILHASWDGIGAMSQMKNWSTRKHRLKTTPESTCKASDGMQTWTQQASEQEGASAKIQNKPNPRIIRYNNPNPTCLEHGASPCSSETHVRHGIPISDPGPALSINLNHRVTLSRSRMTIPIWARLAASATRLKSCRKGAVAVGPPRPCIWWG